jgi:hypothetical protein
MCLHTSCNMDAIYNVTLQSGAVKLSADLEPSITLSRCSLVPVTEIARPWL